MPKNYFFPDLCSISKEPKPNVCHFSGIFRKKSTKMLTIKSGEKQNLEIYCVFLVTLISTIVGLAYRPAFFR